MEKPCEGLTRTTSSRAFTRFEITVREPGRAATRSKSLHLRSTLGEWLHQLRGFSGELFQYNSAKIGLALILLVAALSIYTVIAIPYEASVRLFRTERSEKYQLPETAQPAWTNFFRKNKLPDHAYLQHR